MRRSLNSAASIPISQRRKAVVLTSCEPAATFAIAFELCNLKRMNFADEQAGRGQSAKELVHSVERVEYAFLLRYPPYLHVRAEGHVDTEGWSDAELRIRARESPVSDGILELDFVALPPAGAGIKATTLVHAEIIWEEDVYQIHGVRVHSATGKVKKVFAEGATDNAPPENQP